MIFMILQVDEMKQKETEKTDQLEKAKTAVLDCPMCGKALKTESVGQTLLICHQFMKNSWKITIMHADVQPWDFVRVKESEKNPLSI